MPRSVYKLSDLNKVTPNSGVYLIVNTYNGKVYIGSSVSIRGRLRRHVQTLRRGKHHNQYLQRAWNKAEDDFTFQVLEECDVELLLVREEYWIAHFSAVDSSIGYNLIAKPSTGCFAEGVQHLGTIAAAKVCRGKRRPIEICLRISLTQKGRPKTAEQRAKTKATHWSKRSDAAKIVERSASNHRGKKHTEEHKAKIRKSLKEAYANGSRVCHGACAKKVSSNGQL